MHLATLERLRCPKCLSPLHLSVALHWQSKNQVERGAVVCACGAYHIERGILDLKPTLTGITPAQRSNFWFPTAHVYEPLWRRRALTIISGEHFPVQREAALMLELLQPRGEGLYLDLACSTALQARALARHWAATGGRGRVIALDFALPMLRVAKGYIRQEGWESIDLVRADAERLPLAAGAVDGIVCGGSLNEFRAAWEVLTEARRVAPSGTRSVFMSLLSASPPRGSAMQRVLTLLSGIKFWTPEGTARLFEAAGWSVVGQQVYGGVCFSTLTNN